jgi:glycosyltransferase involved in cell wall biosynthesis
VHRGEGPFDPLRLRSVFAQTYPVWEVVVLDEGEASLDVVDAEARAADRDVSLGLGIAEAWRRAAEMASGDFVWIVECDGRADPTALAALAAPLLAEPDAALAFGASQPADEAGRPHYARPTLIDTAKRLPFFLDRPFDGAGFLSRLADAPAPEISAILWRRDALRGALAASADVDLDRLLRAVAATPGARLHLVAETLNFVVAPEGDR